MSELAEIAYDAMVQGKPVPSGATSLSQTSKTAQDAFERVADAVQTAVFARLIKAAESEGLTLASYRSIPGSYVVEEGGDVADWLRSQQQERGRD